MASLSLLPTMALHMTCIFVYFEDELVQFVMKIGRYSFIAIFFFFSCILKKMIMNWDFPPGFALQSKFKESVRLTNQKIVSQTTRKCKSIEKKKNANQF